MTLYQYTDSKKVMEMTFIFNTLETPTYLHVGLFKKKWKWKNYFPGFILRK